MTNELEKQLNRKSQIIVELQATISNQAEEIKNLNYTLYEERSLTTDLAKANLRISTLERDLSSVKNRFKYENQKYKNLLADIRYLIEEIEEHREFEINDETEQENDQILIYIRQCLNKLNEEIIQ
jgi:peptidoglycan hydrolase CwlO-like protein